MKNHQVILLLRRLNTLLVLKKCSNVLALATRKAIQEIETWPQNAEFSDAFRQKKPKVVFAGYGPKFIRIIQELLDTGGIGMVEQLQQEYDPFFCDLCELPGIGTTGARRIFYEKYIENIDDLRIAATNGVLKTIPAFGDARIRVIETWLRARTHDPGIPASDVNVASPEDEFGLHDSMIMTPVTAGGAPSDDEPVPTEYGVEAPDVCSRREEDLDDESAELNMLAAEGFAAAGTGPEDDSERDTLTALSPVFDAVPSCDTAADIPAVASQAESGSPSMLSEALAVPREGDGHGLDDIAHTAAGGAFVDPAVGESDGGQFASEDECLDAALLNDLRRVRSVAPEGAGNSYASIRPAGMPGAAAPYSVQHQAWLLDFGLSRLIPDAAIGAVVGSAMPLQPGASILILGAACDKLCEAVCTACGLGIRCEVADTVSGSAENFMRRYACCTASALTDVADVPALGQFDRIFLDPVRFSAPSDGLLRILLSCLHNGGSIHCAAFPGESALPPQVAPLLCEQAAESGICPAYSFVVGTMTIRIYRSAYPAGDSATVRAY